MRYVIVWLLSLVAAPVFAAGPDLQGIVQGHILPRYAELAQSTAELSEAAEATCAQDDPTLRGAYHTAFDAWISVSHLRFGPSEVEDRGFAIAFWPDPRGSTPKTLARLVADEDPVVETAEAFATVSVAGRGFYALEYLLFDPQFAGHGDGYLCQLRRAVAADLARNAAAVEGAWAGGYGALLAVPGNDTYRSADEGVRQMLTSLSTGLEFLSNMRLCRPLGTFDRPRPKRAEARRSGRSLRHVVLVLGATRDLAGHLSGQDETLDALFQSALETAERLDDPVFAGVADPGARFRVESLRQQVEGIRVAVTQELGPRLGVAAGFNALDGD